jgi:hypothetical protein
MYALKIVNGAQAGQIYNLHAGKNKLGRSPSSDLCIPTNGVSKEHLEITLQGNHLSLVDLRSSNGTFVNGSRIQSAVIRPGDKITLDKITLVLVETERLAAASASHSPQVFQHPSSAPAPALAPAPPQPPPNYSADEQEPRSGVAMPTNFAEKAKVYVDEVIMPALYRLLEVFDFKTVIIGFAVIFILFITLMSVVPMNQITSESIKNESLRRAVTVARALANANEKAVRSGEMSGYSADLVLRDEGITNVYILGKDGSIIAPPEMVGMSPKAELAGFAQAIKGKTQEMSGEISSGKIAASSPILIFDPELQQNVAKAHAVVVYDAATLKFDDGRALSLFIQMLIIDLILGGVLFYLMYKLIEYPFISLQKEIDSALREGRDQAHIEMQFPALQSVLIAVNSLLNRAQAGGGGSSGAQGMSSAGTLRDSEWMNLVQMVGFPAMLVTKDKLIISVNQAFEQLTGAYGNSLQGQALQFLPDQAMQKNIEALVNSANANTTQVQLDQLDMSGQMFDIQCQAVTVGGDAKYFMITLSPQALEGVG